MYSRPRKNLYQQSIRAIDLAITNMEKDDFRLRLESLEYLMYRVETLPDGREIVLNKPGGKRVFGRVARQDFMVWIHDPARGALWLISHKDIYEDIETKSTQSAHEALRLLALLERVFYGEEPADMLAEINALTFGTGENPEVLLKAYKWIWGQEDCNYPLPKYEGREMSMASLRQMRDRLLAVQLAD